LKGTAGCFQHTQLQFNEAKLFHLNLSMFIETFKNKFVHALYYAED